MHDAGIAWPDWLATLDTSGGLDVQAALADRPERLAQAAALLGVRAVPPGVVRTAPCDFSELPLHDVLTRQILPLDCGAAHGGVVWVMAAPQCLTTREWLQTRWLPRLDRLAMSLPGAVRERLNEIEAAERAMDRFVPESAAPEHAGAALGLPDISLASIAQDHNPVVRLLNSTLFDALQRRASDIHLEAVRDGLCIKYRVDGVLHIVAQCPGADTAQQVVSRIKVLGGMDIAERRVPQDGRVKIRVQGRDIDLRVSVMPNLHGEDVVLRVLDKVREGTVRLDALGFDGAASEAIRALARAPHGMVLVTGPTGSGKSTTLYASLCEIHTGEQKIVTIEDPIEYQLDGILQIPVNDKKGLTFARGLRSILRHDPDIILVGEIRDGETAGIAVQAALTGHLVLSSVHANGAFTVLERFLHMGIEPASLAEALNGVVAQRLVRRVCASCARPAVPDAAALARWGVGATELGMGEFRQGDGCDECHGTGYRGRLAVAEVLHCTEAFKDAMMARPGAGRLRAIAMQVGFVPLRHAALDAARRGETTLQEIQRVIAMD